MQVPKPIQKFLAKFPLHTYPPNEPQRAAPLYPTLWIKAPYEGSLLSADVECLKWQAYLALRGLTGLHVRYDINPQGAVGGRLPNLHLAATEDETPKISDSVSDLFPATYIPTWADKRLNQNSLEGLEGYRDESTRDESRAWISLLEGNVHVALLLSQPSPTAFEAFFSLQDTVPKTQLVESILSPPLPPRIGLASLLPSMLQSSRISLQTVQSNFQDAIAALSDRLGTDRWFLASEAPTALDALVFAYLHSLLHSPLRSVVNNRANLTAWELRVRGLVNTAYKV